ncbi:DNA mismatch repair endonuclease MutH [Aliikangiella maris]|uniref:DNA mismatch repair protein MutH n=2 Tax=Aliikangiella maris TaxID=3162458 RepID=A0ABV2BSI0_9GAMM
MDSPKTIDELMVRAESMSGRSIGEIAQLMQIEVPASLTRKKGWQGQMIEKFLGADSGNLSQPDFSLLDIELKTLPIDYNGKVLESTYVCVLNLYNNLDDETFGCWQLSAVYRKLQHVLWVPVARTAGQSVTEFRVATPFLWRPSEAEMHLLKMDWENAIELVSLGKIDQLNARDGEVLQVRPKAANSKVLTRTTNRQGQLIETLPRGFYLRPQFTQQILAQNLKLS